MATPRLGQHFLTNLQVLDSIVDSARLTPQETILEVGPGEGVLTERLLEQAGRVIAVEKDPDLILKLQTRFSSDLKTGKLILIEGDIREVLQTPRFKLLASSFIVVANIPYYLTGMLLRKLLTGTTLPNRMVLLIQKEVAERIARSKKESLLSLSIKAYGIPRFIEAVPRNAFKPQPAVESAILSIDAISRDFFSALDENVFFEVLHTGFGKKRKQLMGNLSELYPKKMLEDVFEKLNISKTARAEELSLDVWKKLVQTLEMASFR